MPGVYPAVLMFSLLRITVTAEQRSGAVWTTRWGWSPCCRLPNPAVPKGPLWVAGSTGQRNTQKPGQQKASCDGA